MKQKELLVIRADVALLGLLGLRAIWPSPIRRRVQDETLHGVVAEDGTSFALLHTQRLPPGLTGETRSAFLYGIASEAFCPAPSARATDC